MQYSSDKALYFASRFHTAITGAGTVDRNLMRLTVSRCEIDLGNTKVAYQSLYGKTLSDDVRVSHLIHTGLNAAYYSCIFVTTFFSNFELQGDTAGSFQTALLALID